MGDRGIWHSTNKSRAHAGRAGGSPHANQSCNGQPQSNGCSSCSGEYLPAGVAVQQRTEPNRLYLENIENRAIDRDNSRLLDSRINFWCERLGGNPDLYRAALEAGYTVRFVDYSSGRKVTRHTVHPDETD
jgi:hypothetical protein